MIWLEFGFLTRRRFAIPGKEPVEIPSGEIGIQTVACTWRIESGSEVICSSASQNVAGGQIDYGLSLLMDKKVIRANVSFPSRDLHIEFENRHSFRVFNDRFDPATEEDNYEICADGILYTVGCKGIVRTMPSEI